MNLEKDKVGVILCGSETNIQEGDHVKRTGEIVSVPANAQDWELAAINFEKRSVEPLAVDTDRIGGA